MDELVKTLQTKVFNEKNRTNIFVGCAGALALCEVLSIVTGGLGGGFFNILSVLVNLLWSIATFGLIAYGAYKKNDKLFALGILFQAPFLFNGVVNSFSSLTGVIAFNTDQVWLALRSICEFVGYLAVGVGFLIWVLNNFFNYKIKKSFVYLAGIVACLFFLVAIVFAILAKFYFTSIIGYCVPRLFYITLFLCEYSRREA